MEMSVNQTSTIHYQSLEEEDEWLKGVVTGHLKDGFTWDEHGEELRNECVGSLNLTFLGNSVILIRSQTDQSTEGVLKWYEDWSKFWFDRWGPWNPTDVNVRREIWTKWTGVPLQAWSGRFFGLVSAKLGNMVGTHEVTSSRSRLDAAFVKISTGLSSIDRMVDCHINGASFKIRVEEINCMELEANLKQGDEDEYDSESVETFSAVEFDIESVEARGCSDGEHCSDGEETVIGGRDRSNSRSEGEESACATFGIPKKVAATPNKKVNHNDEGSARGKGETNRSSSGSLGGRRDPAESRLGQQMEAGPHVAPDANLANWAPQTLSEDSGSQAIGPTKDSSPINQKGQSFNQSSMGVSSSMSLAHSVSREGEGKAPREAESFTTEEQSNYHEGAKATSRNGHGQRRKGKGVLRSKEGGGGQRRKANRKWKKLARTMCNTRIFYICVRGV